MAGITFFHGTKGGVGTSLFCNAYIHTKAIKDEALIIVDSDAQTPDLFWGHDKSYDVKLIDLIKHEGWMDLIDLVYENSNKEIVVNLPFSIGLQFCKEIDYFADCLKKLSVNMNFYFPINRGAACLISLKSTLEAIREKTIFENTTIIKNGFFGKTEDRFSIWDNSNLKKFFQSAGGKELFISELNDRVTDAVGYKPFSEVLHNSDLEFGIRIDIERWLEKTTELLCPKAS
jgi:hypothetical protein